MSGLDSILVVVPARNEEQLIGDCLASITAAARTMRRELRGSAPHVRIVVVADDCTDATARVARSCRGVEVEAVSHGCVGASRASGVRIALSGPADRHRQWIASTDADSVVPANWLVAQVAFAEAGIDVMIGTVRPRMSDLTAEQREAWTRSHRPGEPNGHVHGANLGIRADAYLDAGGFLDQAEHEDNDLVDRLLARGARSLATDECEVITSGRRYGRTPGGYAGYLREELVRFASAAQALSEAGSA